MAKYSPAQLQKSINAAIEELASLIDEAQFSQEIEAYLDTVAKFHHYSVYNQLLIRDIFPRASHVAGFCTWRDTFNRTSHPTWVRGLKYHQPALGAAKLGRTPRGCVD